MDGGEDNSSLDKRDRSYLNQDRSGKTNGAANESEAKTNPSA